jgi:aspartokinase
MDRLKIGGLKISFALCQFELKGMEPPQKILSNISKALSTEKINIEFLTYNSANSGPYHISLCVNQNNFYSTSKIFQRNDLLPLNWEVIPREGIGMVTIFPYDSALAILAVIMVSWGKNSIPIYGVATSLSAVSFLTDFQAIDKAVEVIQASFQLPGNHAPLKPELHYYQSSLRKKD